MDVGDVRQRHLIPILDNLESANRNRVLSILKGIFNFAILKELITTLPTTAIKRARRPRSTRHLSLGELLGTRWRRNPLYAGC